MGTAFAETAQLPYISVVDTAGNPHKYGADIGANVEVKANADGSNTFALTYDAMDGVNVFKGWFNGDTFLSDELTFTAPADINKDNVKARIICRSVISGGLGFENYIENTALRVHPEDSKGNLHNVAPFDDKWGQMYKSYQQADDRCMTITTNYGSKNNVKYIKDVIIETAKVTYDYISVNPYSGNSMFNFSTPGRAVVRKLDNLKPNTNYELSFYVYNTSEYEFLYSAVIGNKHTLSRSTVYSGTIDEEIGKDNYEVVYAAYVAKVRTFEVGGNDYKALADKNKVRSWNKITVQFTTDEDDTSLYLKLASSTVMSQESTNHIFIDNLSCTETVVGYAGNAMRAKDEGKPQALRYKFAVANKMLYNFEGMSFKKIGILAVKSEICGTNTLEIGKKYTFNGKEKSIADVTVNPETNFQYVEGDTQNTYFTAALYNIGVGSKGDINYDTYAEGYVVRPYIIYEDENGAECLVYGVTVDVSVFDVMYAVLRDGRKKVT